MSEVRKVLEKDLDGLKDVLNSIELFPAEMLDDMLADYFSNPKSEDIWFTKIENDKPVSIGYCAPEKLTNGTFNLYAIGVRNDIQGKGIGHSVLKCNRSRFK